MDVRLPDGTIVRNVPDNITKAELATKLKANGMAVPAEWMGDAPQPQAAEQAGAALRQVPRQIGLTARYGMEGLGQVADVFTAPIRLAVNPLLEAAGLPRAGTLTSAASGLADKFGLPAPQTANERVVGDAARTMAGAGGMVGAARGVAGATTGIAQNVASRMAANSGAQVAGAATAGASGGAVREAGGTPVEQFMASLLGGVAGGMAASGAANVTQRAKTALTPQAVKTAAADQQIALSLERQGVDWSQVPERVRQSVRDEVAGALQTGGQLNGEALRRLLAFRNTGTTPTVGMLTQNPGQITREMNLAKTGANSIDPSLQKLPAIQNQNAAQLLRQLDEAGAAGAPDAMAAGQRVVGALQSRANAAKANIGSLYQQARDSGGRSLPLEGGTFTQRANALLDADNVGSFLPPDIARKMNDIALGKFPLTVDVAEQLKTSIGNLQRGSADGNVRRALGLVRQALDDTPLQNSAKAGGNQVAIPGQVAPSVAAGEESVAAFNAARAANRTWMQKVEGNPALKAVVDGVEPDQFIARFVVGKGASARDVGALKAELGPDAVEALKGYLVRHLRNAATNSTDDITKFSNDAYRRAFRDIGEDKLRAFFSPQELQKLRDVGEAAKYMQAQPVGSAVNNSNSGALVLGRGLDMLEQAASYVPFGGRDIIKGVIQGQQQRQTLNPLLALTQPQFRQRPNPMLGAVIAAPAQAREDDRRR